MLVHSRVALWGLGLHNLLSYDKDVAGLSCRLLFYNKFMLSYDMDVAGLKCRFLFHNKFMLSYVMDVAG